MQGAPRPPGPKRETPMTAWLAPAAWTLAVVSPGAVAAWFTCKTTPAASGARNWGVTPGPDPDYAFAGAAR